ncbi:hypothetical protein [Cryobacterium sp. PAMC25264]|uniref:hypothetical protein n=1 Tax=Cryobacterium sp. PAMC25264 TaxID=2861288 RepID=UPI001C63214F|nr:hypothetical protein [Cryobacterium sp. PAMC25264]QYF72699.1 hypothetical protein KY500_12920 [Cryobacterium sp. PAMC25264]
MDKNRFWMIGSILIMIVVLVGGTILGIQPQLAAAAAANAQRDTVATANAGQAAVLDQLKQDFTGLESLKSELAPLNASVPSETGMAAFFKQLDALAGSTQVTLKGITVADPAPYVPVVAPEAVAAPATETDSSASPAPTAVPEPGTPSLGTPPVTNSKITTENFASMDITVTVKGSYVNTLQFVNGLQTGARLFLVSGLTSAHGAGDEAAAAPDDVTATISGLVYVLVPSGQEVAPVE